MHPGLAHPTGQTVLNMRRSLLVMLNALQDHVQEHSVADQSPAVLYNM